MKETLETIASKAEALIEQSVKAEEKTQVALEEIKSAIADGFADMNQILALGFILNSDAVDPETKRKVKTRMANYIHGGKHLLGDFFAKQKETNFDG